MSQVTGKEVTCCFDLVNRIWKEVDLMADRLDDLLKKEIEKEAGWRFIDAARSKGLTQNDYAYFDDDLRDVYIGHIHNIPVKTRPRLKKPDRFFGFQISLADRLIDIPGNEEPVIYMYTSPACEMGFEEEEWHMSFPMDPDEDDTDFEVQNRMVLKWSDGSIVYAVRLMGLQNEDDLRKLCIKPLMALYNGQSVEQAAKASVSPRA